MHIKFTLSHRTSLPASVIATSLPLNFITDLQLAHKETTYWPKYTIKCVGFSIRLPYTTETTRVKNANSAGYKFGHLVLYTDKGYELIIPVNQNPLYALAAVGKLGAFVVPFRNRSDSSPVAE